MLGGGDSKRTLAREAGVSAKRPVEHFKNALQHITTDRTPNSVLSFDLPLPANDADVQERKETLTASGKFWEIRALSLSVTYLA